MADARYQDEWDCGCAWNWMDDIFIMCPMHKSAPDLLQALEAIVTADDGALAELRAMGLQEPPAETIALTEAARAAIAKAKGETE